MTDDARANGATVAPDAGEAEPEPLATRFDKLLSMLAQTIPLAAGELARAREVPKVVPGALHCASCWAVVKGIRTAVEDAESHLMSDHETWPEEVDRALQGLHQGSSRLLQAMRTVHFYEHAPEVDDEGGAGSPSGPPDPVAAAQEE